MRDMFAYFTSLTIPFNAAPTDPRIFLGSEVPTELSTFNPATFDFQAVILWYTSATDYYFQAVGEYLGVQSFFEGTYDSVNGVNILSRLDFVNVPGSVVTAFGTGLGIGLNSLASEYWFGGFGNRDVHIMTGESRDVGWGIVANGSATGGFLATGAGVETAIPDASYDGATSPSVDFRAGRCYEMQLDHGMFANAPGATNQTRVRIRKGTASIVGQILGEAIHDVPNSFAVTSKSMRTFVRNNTGADISTDLSITVQRLAGAAANFTITGQPDVPLNLTVKDRGRIARSGFTGLRFYDIV